MMKNQDGAVQPRLRIVDTSGPEYSGATHNKRVIRRTRPQKQHQPQQEQSNTPQWPIETLVIQRAVLEYGRRTAALGAQQGAQALRALALKIRELGPPTPALEKIVLDAETTAAKLRTQLDQVYEDDR